jgi:hypothetical protein
MEVTTDRVFLAEKSTGNMALFEIDLATAEVVAQWPSTHSAGLACGPVP